MTAGRKLLVLEGAHAGAELFLAPGSYLVGSGLECDVMLLDSGVQMRHLRIQVDNSLVNAERLEDALVLLHGTALANSRFTILDGDVIRLGAAALSVAMAVEVVVAVAESPTQDGPAPKFVSNANVGVVDKSVSRRGRRTLALSVTVALFGMGAYFASRVLEAPERSQVRTPSEALASTKQNKDIPTPGSTHKKEDFVARVREFVGDDTLDVQVDPQGRIIVAGSAAKATVKEQLQRIKKEYTGTIEIIDQVDYVVDKTQRNKFPLSQKITDVSVGQIRWFRTADGTRHFEGSQMTDGAEVVRISLDNIVFQRDGKLITFRVNEKEFER